MTVEETLQLAVKYRAIVIKTADVEVHMSPQSFDVPGVGVTSLALDEGEKMPTDAEMMLWSAGGDMPDVKTRPPEENPVS